MDKKQGLRARLLHGEFLAMAVAFLYLCQFRLPCTPVFTGGDDNGYLSNALRMLDGQMIYRDFFEFVTPGLTVFNAGLFKLLGIHLWIPQASLICLGLGIVALIIILSQRVLHGAAAYLPAALFLTCAFGFGLDDTEHWYSALFELAAIATVIEKRTSARLIFAGMLCGLASFFMQTQGFFTVIGLAIFLIWEGRRTKDRWLMIGRYLGCLAASFAATVLATNAYFVCRVGLTQFLYCTVVFPLKYYSADRQSNSIYTLVFEFRDMLNSGALPAVGIFLFIHALLPLVYLWFWVRSRRETPEPNCLVSLMLLSVVGFLQCMGFASAPTTFRLAAVTAPGLILLVWLLRGQRTIPRVLSAALWVVVAGLAVGLPLQIQSQQLQSIDLPRGRVAVDSVSYDSLLWWSSHTHSGELVFTAANSEILFPLDLRNPTEVKSVTNTDFTRPEQVRKVLASLEEKRVRFVLWDSVEEGEGALPSSDVPSGPVRAYLRRCYRVLKTFLGGDYLPMGDHLGPFRDYLNAHYHVVKSFPSGLEVWERNN